MSGSLVAMALALAASSAGGLFSRGTTAHDHNANHGQFFHNNGGRIMPPGPGYGWGFPNGQPDGYGWVDYSTYLPLGANRTPDYYFPRYFSVPPAQVVMPTYYNPYLDRGQRYIPFTACGGDHPAGHGPTGSSVMPMHPYQESLNAPPAPLNVPTYSGRSTVPVENLGSSGLVP